MIQIFALIIFIFIVLTLVLILHILNLKSDVKLYKWRDTYWHNQSRLWGNHSKKQRDIFCKYGLEIKLPTPNQELNLKENYDKN